MSAWRGEPDILAPVSQGADLSTLVADAAIWAERVTLCVTAPHSERGSLPWWRELLARNSKCDGIYVRQGERAEPWLLHRLHAVGALRLVDGGGPDVASHLLMFARGDELRVLLSHVSLERAVAGAAFGTLLAFRGRNTSELARACQAQVERFAALARIVSGQELDVMLRDGRQRAPPPSLDLARSARIVSEPAALAECLERLSAAPRDPPAPLTADVHAVKLRANAFGYQLSTAHGKDARFVLTLYAGDYWAAGNAVVVDAGAGRIALVWRGDLLGPSRSRAQLVWAETRLSSGLYTDPTSGLSRRVAQVADGSAPLGPQLAHFARELRRLSDLFGVEPAPVLGHVLADFATLAPKQQLVLVWRALIGSGALEVDAAASAAAESLRAQGYQRTIDPESRAAAERQLRELLLQAADQGKSFDRPSAGTLRAIQPDPALYVLDDWIECLLLALPEHTVIPRRAALHLALDWAREHWGLGDATLRRNPDIERALEAAVASALCRGLILRVGAGGLERLTSSSPRAEEPRGTLAANASEHGFVAGWARALAGLEPLSRSILGRRSGWYGQREALPSVARRLGLTLERARYLEADAWQKLEAGSGWVRALRARLERALGAARAMPIRLLMLDDAWWRGLDRHLELLDAIFEGLLGGQLWRVELGTPGEVFIARFSPIELERALGDVRARTAEARLRGESLCGRALAAEACSTLDRGIAEYVGELIEAELDGGATPSAAATRELDAGQGGASEAELRLEDGLSSIFRAAGTPLSLSSVAERLRRRADVPLPHLAQRLARAPFVQLDTDRYGLLARDVPGGPSAIASVLDDVTEALEASQHPLDAARTLEIVRARVEQGWSEELVHSLLASDPVLAVSRAHATSLRRWHVSEAADDPPYPGLPAAMRSRFEALVQQAPWTDEALARRLGMELARLERTADSDELWALPLARQLGDLSGRLLERAATEPPDRTRWIHAAIAIFLDAIAADEDDFDATLIERERLSDARAVLAAVLRWLGFDGLGAGAARAGPT